MFGCHTGGLLPKERYLGNFVALIIQDAGARFLLESEKCLFLGEPCGLSSSTPLCVADVDLVLRTLGDVAAQDVLELLEVFLGVTEVLML